RWLRHATSQLADQFRYLPQQPGYNKRLRAGTDMINVVIRILSVETTLFTDDVWVAGSTPVECGHSRETPKRSDLAGCAEYGYCASHSRYFWGMRLHRVCTLGGLPMACTLTRAKADERQTLLGMLANDPDLVAQRQGQTLIADKNYFGTEFESTLAQAGMQ